MMDLVDLEGRRTSRLIEEHATMVQDALQVFLDRKILERVGFASRQDLVKMQPQPELSGAEEPEEPDRASPDDGIITTDTELRVFDHVKTRLAYLVKDDALFAIVQELTYLDYKTLFTVFYKFERKGRVLNFREGPNGGYRFDFPDLEETIETNDLYDIDGPLLQSFLNRVKDVDGAAEA